MSAYGELLFQDEFSSTVIDTTKWTTDIYYKPNNATQNFNLSSGNLNIWPSVDGTGSFFDRTFHTDGTFNAQNFFCEAEIKLPRGRGLRPVFALFNDDEHEIIVMNAYPGAPTAGWASADLSPIDYKMASTENFSGGPSDERRASSYFVSAPDLSAAFHTFGVHFGASAIRWYYDGVQIGTTHTNTYQTVPMYIYIGLWMSTMETSPTVGSGTLSSSNPYTPQGVANAMQVNYVRAWRIL